MNEKRMPQGRPIGGSNWDQAATQIVRDTIAHRQNFLATVNNTMIASGPITLTAQSTTVANATVIKAQGVAAGRPLLGQPKLVVHSSEDAQAPNPPAIPDFLLVLFAKSKSDVAAVGDINERFNGDCRKFGSARARRRYWAETLQFLWPLLARTISRAMKLAVIVGAVKRYFLD
jgi:hypothetical protein